MAQDILKSTTTFAVVFQLIASSDHITGLTGKSGSVVVQISKNGGAGATPSGAITEVDATNLPGVYKLAGNATDSGTAGPLWIYAKDAASDPYCALVANVIDPTVANYGANVVNWLGTVVSTPTVAGVPNVNAKTWNDLATVALPLIPTTAGRTLDVSAGGEAGLDWANVGSPTTTVGLSGTTVGVLTTYTGNTVQTGDAYARLGAPAGASVSVDIAAIKTETAEIDAVADIIGSPAGATIAADIAAIKAETAEIDSVTDQFAFTVPNQVDANTLKIGGTTQTGGDVGIKTGFALTSAYDFAKGTAAMTESYAANAAAPTPVQAIFAIHQMLMDFGISSTNYTVKKLDNSTTAFVVVLDSATTPTAASRT